MFFIVNQLFIAPRFHQPDATGVRHRLERGAETSSTQIVSKGATARFELKPSALGRFVVNEKHPKVFRSISGVT